MRDVSTYGTLAMYSTVQQKNTTYKEDKGVRRQISGPKLTVCQKSDAPAALSATKVWFLNIISVSCNSK